MNNPHEIVIQLQRLCSVLGKQSEQVLQAHLGIGFSQYKLLRVLRDHPKIRQKQIAVILEQTEASISRQVGLMSDLGLLQVIVSPKNRREHIAVPTNKGLQLTQQASELLDETHAAIFKQINYSNQKQLYDILLKLHS